MPLSAPLCPLCPSLPLSAPLCPTLPLSALSAPLCPSLPLLFVPMKPPLHAHETPPFMPMNPPFHGSKVRTPHSALRTPLSKQLQTAPLCLSLPLSAPLCPSLPLSAPLLPRLPARPLSPRWSLGPGVPVLIFLLFPCWQFKKEYSTEKKIVEAAKARDGSPEWLEEEAEATKKGLLALYQVSARGRPSPVGVGASCVGREKQGGLLWYQGRAALCLCSGRCSQCWA